MFNIGAGEMIFILIAALLILGPQRLPELARGIGRFLREFRRQTDEVRSVVVREFYQMDQELQREPAPPAQHPPAPHPPAQHPPPHNMAPELAPPTQPSLPLPSSMHAPLEGGIQAHPDPAGPKPVEAAQAAVPAVAPSAMSAVAPPAVPGGAEEEREEPLPRFDPIPGTVARNAPKQS